MSINGKTGIGEGGDGGGGFGADQVPAGYIYKTANSLEGTAVTQNVYTQLGVACTFPSAKNNFFSNPLTNVLQYDGPRDFNALIISNPSIYVAGGGAAVGIYNDIDGTPADSSVYQTLNFAITSYRPGSVYNFATISNGDRISTYIKNISNSSTVNVFAHSLTVIFLGWA